MQEWVLAFISRTSRANPVFKSSISNWRFSGAAFPNRTEWVCLPVKPLEQIQCSNLVFKTQIEPVWHRIKQACSSVKLACSLWLYPSYRTDSSTEQRYVAKLLIFNKYSGKLTDDTRWIGLFSSRIKAVPHGSVLSQLLIMVFLWYTIIIYNSTASTCINKVHFPHTIETYCIS